MSNIIVFGGTGGIGGALVKRLINQGHRVLVTARNAERLKALETEKGITTHAGDARDSKVVKTAFQAASEQLGEVHGAVNLVGSIVLKPIHATTDEAFHDVIQTNLQTAFWIAREGAIAMRKTGGSIVLVSTVAAARGLPNHEAIAAAKAGVEGLTRATAATYVHSNLRVNCIAPGLTETPLSEPLLSNETARKASLAMHPLGRFGKPDNIASAIDWLLQPEQDWITGQVLAIDGGLSTIQGKLTIAP